MTTFGIERVSSACCGFDLATFIVSDKLYSSTHDLETIKEEPTVNIRLIKQLTCRLTSKMCAVTHDDVLMIRTNADFVHQKMPLEYGETIVSVLTGYNYIVMVVGKKKIFRLHPGWKFDDVEIMAQSI